ncbi:fibroblast growth factor 1 isoform X3 [Sciurus carolinensis]|uniref:fibroblast growth factor 1 isoform X3 n=1 Tax=Sciurus carolinensis TaxID=30640 RepID=UPI001FB1C74B|nr:fibroblast growth factor 1 isoform X3 [Sciurus carolinensis]
MCMPWPVPLPTQSYSSPEVQRAGLGLLGKQPQQGDSDKHRAEDTKSILFPQSRREDSLQPTSSAVQLQLSAESVGEVYIKSTETGQYLAMDTDGLLYGSQTPNEECLFLERLEENHYNTYTSKKHAEKNWFVGLKKNGSCKRGPRTHYGQKAILFLPLPVSSD